MFGGTRGMVIKSLWGVLIAAVAVFSADRTFFFLSPYTKNWFNSTRLAGITTRGMKIPCPIPFSFTAGGTRYFRSQ